MRSNCYGNLMKYLNDQAAFVDGYITALVETLLIIEILLLIEQVKGEIHLGERQPVFQQSCLYQGG